MIDASGTAAQTGRAAHDTEHLRDGVCECECPACWSPPQTLTFDGSCICPPCTDEYHDHTARAPGQSVRS